MTILGITSALWLTTCTNMVAAISFYLVYAAGMMNLSQAGFMAIGAYAIAIAAKSSVVPFWLGALLGFVVITTVALMLAGITARLGGIYLGMATLAFIIVIQQLIIINPHLGGAVGIHGIPRLITPASALCIVVLVSFLARVIMKSRLGYEMRIVREDHIAAQSMGINVLVVRLQTSVLSAWIAGIAGAMEALHTNFIGPHDFGFPLLIGILSFAIVGGTDRWWGPLIGALLLTFLPQTTRAFRDYREIISGALILSVMLAFPEGTVGIVLRLRSFIYKKKALIGIRSILSMQKNEKTFKI